LYNIWSMSVKKYCRCKHIFLHDGFLKKYTEITQFTPSKIFDILHGVL
jgi:hypothetical protein